MLKFLSFFSRLFQAIQEKIVNLNRTHVKMASVKMEELVPAMQHISGKKFSDSDLTMVQQYFYFNIFILNTFKWKKKKKTNVALWLACLWKGQKSIEISFRGSIRAYMQSNKLLFSLVHALELKRREKIASITLRNSITTRIAWKLCLLMMKTVLPLLTTVIYF